MQGRATRIEWLSLRTPSMRVFHLGWLASSVCFFAWFAAAPLMPLIRREFALSAAQLADLNIAAVAVTVLARLLAGPLCDRYGPRRTCAALLWLGAIPMFGMACAHDGASFLGWRLAAGVVGAGFVITQYHTTTMFAPNVVGTANAIVAGWGNAGAGLAQTALPWLLTALLVMGVGGSVGWRVALAGPGVLLLAMGVLYARCAPDGPPAQHDPHDAGGRATFLTAARNYRVWLLSAAYACCFGVELFVHGMAATYCMDRYGMDLRGAGLAVGVFGLLALGARPLGGALSDRLAQRRGLLARSALLAALLLGEGLALLAFAGAPGVTSALVALLGAGLCVHMACGATYALVPFVERRALGGVAGIVGAGGNVGGVAAGLLLKGVGSVPHTFALLGGAAIVGALCVLLLRFGAGQVASEERLYRDALRQHEAGAAAE